MGAFLGGCRKADDAAVAEVRQKNDRGATEVRQFGRGGATLSASTDGEDVFYDARQYATKSMRLSVYTPAISLDVHPRNSIVMDDPQTLLSSPKKSPNAVPPRGMDRRRSSGFIRHHLLNEPRLEVQLRGYPGDLNEEELDACLKFRKQLREKDEAYQEMVHCFHGVEEEPYALCRFMRSRKFNVQDAFAMMDESIGHWNEAKQHDFYPTVEAAVGCPPSVFLTQYPYLFAGNAKNGAPVAYFMCGRLKLEGIECVTELEQINNYAWNTVMHQFKKQVAVAQGAHPNMVVRCENVAVFDLKGLGSSQLCQQSLDVMKRLGDVSSCFPELLNRLVVLNAPRFFTMFWPMIRSFMDPRTVAKIDIFSNERKGKARLLELISKEELLSNYGGKAPSFDETAQEKQLGSNSCARQVVELMSIKPQYQANWNGGFELTADEQATVRVFTRSSAGANISILKGNKETVKTFEVRNPAEGSKPYSVEVASNMKGPGTFSIVATSMSSSTTDHFLVFVQVFSL